MKEPVTYQAILEEGVARGKIVEAKKFLQILGQIRLDHPMLQRAES